MTKRSALAIAALSFLPNIVFALSKPGISDDQACAETAFDGLNVNFESRENSNSKELIIAGALGKNKYALRSEAKIAASSSRCDDTSSARNSASQPAIQKSCLNCLPLPCGDITINSATASNAHDVDREGSCGMARCLSSEGAASRIANGMAGYVINIPCFGNNCTCTNKKTTGPSTGAPFTWRICVNPPGYPSCILCVTATWTLTTTRHIGSCAGN